MVERSTPLPRSSACTMARPVRLPAGLSVQQLGLHGQHGLLVQLVGQLERGLHVPHVGDDHLGIAGGGLADLGQGDLAGAGGELLDLRRGRGLGAQQDGRHRPERGESAPSTKRA
ncbi:hypothetical protein ACFSBG_19055 [Georgenia yuyongxinii]|uniref:hypothetical protein n=1 Tax=Georgenia yuyongxinii TaxID=2589797 RepID=UPI00143D8EB9|nr:hypothetical protein [Georgenia yuyongxinii]